MKVGIFVGLSSLISAASFSWIVDKIDAVPSPPSAKGRSGMRFFLPWMNDKCSGSNTPRTRVPQKNDGSASKQDLLGPMLAKLGLRADPLTLSILAGFASLLMVFLRRTADTAVISASSAIRKVTLKWQTELSAQKRTYSLAIKC